MSSINNLITRILGKRIGLRLGVYKPENISKDNKVVYSYIYGIDDVVQQDHYKENDFGASETLVKLES